MTTVATQPLLRRATRTERLDIRMTPDSRATLVQAANLTGASLTDYVINASLAAAQQEIARHTSISLSKSAWDEFARVLDEADYGPLDETLARPTVWDKE